MGKSKSFENRVRALIRSLDAESAALLVAAARKQDASWNLLSPEARRVGLKLLHESQRAQEEARESQRAQEEARREAEERRRQAQLDSLEREIRERKKAFLRYGATRIVAVIKRRLAGKYHVTGYANKFPKSTYLRVTDANGDSVIVRISDHAQPEYGGYRVKGQEEGRFGASDFSIDPTNPRTVSEQIADLVRALDNEFTPL